MAYGNDQAFQDWLAAQGLSLPDDAPPLAVLRQIGSSYVDSAYGYMLSCSRKTGGWDQELEWPRTGHRVNGSPFPSDLIPNAWIYASYRAAYLNAVNPGWSTSATGSTQKVRRERLSTLEVEYFDDSSSAGSSASAGMPTDAIINGLVLPFLCKNTRSLNSLFRVV